jgi:hypothetical protein
MKRKAFVFQITTFCILLACLFQSCIFSSDPVLEERKKNQVGNYIIDMERTEWGEYEVEKDNYKDLMIVFNSDMTFEVGQSVPFLLDTTGQYVIKGAGRLCEVHFASDIQKHGISEYGTWLWPCWEDQMNDSITVLVTPTPQQNEKRVIPKLYFRKTGRF